MENKTLQAVLSAAIAAFYGVHGCACRANYRADGDDDYRLSERYGGGVD